MSEGRIGLNNAIDYLIMMTNNQTFQTSITVLPSRKELRKIKVKAANDAKYGPYQPEMWRVQGPAPNPSSTHAKPTLTECNSESFLFAMKASGTENCPYLVPYSTSGWNGVNLGDLKLQNLRYEVRPTGIRYSGCQLGIENTENLSCRVVKTGWPLIVEYTAKLLGVEAGGCHWGFWADKTLILTRHPSNMVSLKEYERRGAVGPNIRVLSHSVAVAVIQLILTGHTRITKANMLVSEDGRVRAYSRIQHPEFGSRAQTISIASDIIRAYFGGSLYYLVEVCRSIFAADTNYDFEFYYSTHTNHITPEDSWFIPHAFNLKNRLLTGEISDIFSSSTVSSRTRPSRSKSGTRSRKFSGVSASVFSQDSGTGKDGTSSGNSETLKLGTLTIRRQGNTFKLEVSGGAGGGLSTLELELQDGFCHQINLDRMEVVGVTGPTELTPEPSSVMEAPTVMESEVSEAATVMESEVSEPEVSETATVTESSAEDRTSQVVRSRDIGAQQIAGLGFSILNMVPPHSIETSIAPQPLIDQVEVSVTTSTATAVQVDDDAARPRVWNIRSPTTDSIIRPSNTKRKRVKKPRSGARTAAGQRTEQA